MSIRATSRFDLLRYEPTNPEFPTLPDGVIVPHVSDFGRSAGLAARQPIVSRRIKGSAPANDRQRFAGWQTDTTWVNPVLVDFGVIPSPVQKTLSLYNARSTPVIVTALPLPTGVTLIGPALPQTLEPYDGVVFTLEASTIGPNEFDEFVTFTTSAGDVTFRVIGRRVFTINAVPQRPINETLIWRTEILRSTNASEKAYSLLQSPIAVIDYRVKFTDDLQRIRFKNNFAAGQSALVVAAQKWYEARQLTVAALSGDTVLNVPTDYTSFAVGQPISCVTNDGQVAAGQIDSLTSSTITLSAAIGLALPVGTHVMPVGLGYVSRFPSYAVYPVNLEEVSYTVAFNQEVDQTALDPMFPLLPDYQSSPATSTPILEFCNQQSRQQFQLHRSEDVLDSGLSNRVAFNEFLFGDDVSDFELTLNGIDLIWKWRQFFHYLRGSYLDFYVPTFRNDIPSVTTTTSNTFNAPDTDLFLLFGNPPNDRRAQIRLLYPDGTILYRTITAIVDNVTTEQITVDSNLINGSPIISFLQRARIFGDTVNFNFLRIDEAVMTFKYRTIEK